MRSLSVFSIDSQQLTQLTDCECMMDRGNCIGFKTLVAQTEQEQQLEQVLLEQEEQLHVGLILRGCLCMDVCL